MGVSYYAKLYCGVGVEEREVSKDVTKYDEDTGKPYRKTVTETKLFIIDTDIEIDTDDYFNYDEDGVHLVHDYCGDVDLIGQRISETDSYQSYLSIVSEHDITKAKAEFSNYMATKYGYNGPVHLINYLSVC